MGKSTNFSDSQKMMRRFALGKEKWPNTCFIESQHKKTEHQLEQYHVHVLYWFVRRPSTYYEKYRSNLVSRRTIGTRSFRVSQYMVKHTALGMKSDEEQSWRVDYSAINSPKGWRIIDIRFRGDFGQFENDLCIVKLFRDRKNHRKIA
jgi:hypothetical protein